MALTSKSDGIWFAYYFWYTIEYVQTDSMNGRLPMDFEGGDFSNKGDLIIGKMADSK